MITESQVVNEWISMGRLTERRQVLLQVLNGKFPGAVSNDVVQLIQQQESLELLQDWLTEALRAFSYDQLLAVLKR